MTCAYWSRDDSRVRKWAARCLVEERPFLFGFRLDGSLAVWEIHPDPPAPRRGVARDTTQDPLAGQTWVPGHRRHGRLTLWMVACGIGGALLPWVILYGF